ncbi:hypothetical protein HMPREF3180_01872 [Leptotrichia wadei]|uniref:Uncharacterized protein n=1 Tax=Leptotrichia wadei TaxID=157687 RepID=A0A134A002_9FUSO|nr:hypothetical protein HMPREF3180_01872 [Leptotrichia wadei]
MRNKRGWRLFPFAFKKKKKHINYKKIVINQNVNVTCLNV